MIFNSERVHEMKSLLLDSSLITAYNKIVYNVKIVDCGTYKQVYYFERNKNKKDKDLEPLLNFEDYDELSLYKLETIKNSSVNDLKHIEYKNILRSKLCLQRLVKCNEDVFKSFITLTFADNLTSIDSANKIFHSWVTNIKKVNSNFTYVCVPEFQKRGAVHYHLLTNLDVKLDYNIIIPQKGKRKCYDVLYWNKGFARVDILKDKNVVGYITKYMTKDVDIRLYGRRRYFYTQNLIKPKEYVLNLSNEEHKQYLDNLISHSGITYSNLYTDRYNLSRITFTEYKAK